jgi:hypothetical protein
MNLALQNDVVGSAGQVFVRNSLVVITPKDNPGKINALVNLKKSGLKLAGGAGSTRRRVCSAGADCDGQGRGVRRGVQRCGAEERRFPERTSSRWWPRWSWARPTLASSTGPT